LVSSSPSHYICRKKWIFQIKTISAILLSLKFEQKLTSADDHLVQEFSLLRKVFQQFIFGHPDKIITFSNIKFVGCNNLGFEEEALP